MRLLIIGGFGYLNLGDEAILGALLAKLKKRKLILLNQLLPYSDFFQSFCNKEDLLKLLAFSDKFGSRKIDCSFEFPV